MSVSNETLLCLCIALFFAASGSAFYAYFLRTVLGRLPRALLAARAFSAAQAKTLSELHLSATRALTRAYRRHSSLFFLVCAVLPESEKKAALPPRKLGTQAGDPSLAGIRFYLPEKDAKKASRLYASHVGGLLSPILITLSAALVAAGLYRLIPLFVEITA